MIFCKTCQPLYHVHYRHASGMKKRGSRASITSQNVQTVTSAEGEERIVVIPSGNHVFPFEFTLPLDLPASFDGKWGQIKYWAKVTLERPWKFDIEREKEFKVKAHVDLNLEPELVVSFLSVALLVHIYVNCWSQTYYNKVSRAA